MSNQTVNRNESTDKAAVLLGLLAMGEKGEEVKRDPLYDRLTLILDPVEQFASLLEQSEGDNASEVLVLENLLERARGEIKKLIDALEEQAGGPIDVVFRNRPYLHKGFYYHDIVGFEVEGNKVEVNSHE